MSARRDAFGLLSVLRLPPTKGHTDDNTDWNAARAGAALTHAPLVGGVLGVIAGLVAMVLAPVDATLAAVVAVALLAWLTRGLHLDGVSDTADGLGSARPPAEALALMRRGDIGPFGVTSVILVLLLDIAALSALLRSHAPTAAWALLVAVVTGRLATQIACRAGVPPAHQEGLGFLVAQTQTPARLLRGLSALAGWTVLPLLLALLAAATLVARLDGAGPTPTPGHSAWAHLDWTHVAVMVAVAAAAAALGLLATEALLRRCVRRLGGVTGDVLGACVEVAQTVVLVVLAIALA